MQTKPFTIRRFFSTITINPTMQQHRFSGIRRKHRVKGKISEHHFFDGTNTVIVIFYMPGKTKIYCFVYLPDRCGSGCVDTSPLRTAQSRAFNAALESCLIHNTGVFESADRDMRSIAKHYGIKDTPTSSRTFFGDRWGAFQRMCIIEKYGPKSSALDPVTYNDPR